MMQFDRLNLFDVDPLLCQERRFKDELSVPQAVNTSCKTIPFCVNILEGKSFGSQDGDGAT